MPEPLPYEGGVTVGVIVRNEEANLERCLLSILEQEDLHEPLEILVIDNDSSDSTPQIAARIGRQWREKAEVRVIRMRSNNLGAARDQAVQASRYDWIAFTDADCVVPKRWLRGMLDGFQQMRTKHLDVAAVGTSNQPPAGVHPFYDALRVMFSSFFGHLNSTQAKLFDRESFVEHLSTCSVLYDRKAVLRSGGFSDRFDRVCEDVDLSRRLHAAGSKLVILSSTPVTHFHVLSHRAWFKKIFRYGWGQLLVMRHSSRRFVPRLALPPLFIAGLASTPLIGIKVFLAALLTYLSGLIVVSALISLRSKRLDLWHRVTCLHLITHFAYGLGMFWGFRLLFSRTAQRHGRKFCFTAMRECFEAGDSRIGQ